MRAIRGQSKPFLALSVVEAAAYGKNDGVPPLLREVIDETVRLARG